MLRAKHAHICLFINTHIYIYLSFMFKPVYIHTYTNIGDTNRDIHKRMQTGCTAVEMCSVLRCIHLYLIFVYLFRCIYIQYPLFTYVRVQTYKQHCISSSFLSHICHGYFTWERKSQIHMKKTFTNVCVDKRRYTLGLFMCGERMGLMWRARRHG